MPAVLVFQLPHEFGHARVADRPGQPAVALHPVDVQGLHRHAAAFGDLRGGLVVVVRTQAGNPGVLPGRFPAEASSIAGAGPAVHLDEAADGLLRGAQIRQGVLQGFGVGDRRLSPRRPTARPASSLSSTAVIRMNPVPKAGSVRLRAMPDSRTFADPPAAVVVVEDGHQGGLAGIGPQGPVAGIGDRPGGMDRVLLPGVPGEGEVGNPAAPQAGPAGADPVVAVA